MPKGSLPNYAQGADTLHLVRIFCTGCRCGRLAQLNQQFLGKESLTSDSKAVCLKCKRPALDYYNWTSPF